VPCHPSFLLLNNHLCPAHCLLNNHLQWLEPCLLLAIRPHVKHFD
jgi:hypothetical protein